MEYIRKENTTAVRTTRRLLKSFTSATTIGERDFILSSIACLKGADKTIYENVDAWLDLQTVVPTTKLVVEYINNHLLVVYHQKQNTLIPYLVLLNDWVYQGEEITLQRFFRENDYKGLKALYHTLRVLKKYTVLPVVPALQREGRISLQELQAHYKGQKYVD